MPFFSSVNGSYHHVKAAKKGKTSINSSIFQLCNTETGESHTLATPLTKTQEVEIYSPVRLYPRELILLHDMHGYHYQYQMNVRQFVCVCEKEREREERERERERGKEGGREKQKERERACFWQLVVIGRKVLFYSVLCQ